MAMLIACWDPEWAERLRAKLENIYPEERGSVYLIHHDSAGHGIRNTSLIQILKFVLAHDMSWRCFFLNTDFGYESCIDAVDLFQAHVAHAKTPVVIFNGSNRSERDLAIRANTRGYIDSQKIGEPGLLMYLATLSI